MNASATNSEYTMRISEFKYDGQNRIAAELRPANGGLLHLQLWPIRGCRTFKPGKMMDSREVKGLRRLFWLFRFKVGI